MAKIGFIGLGHMGNPMVKNLLKAGHKLKVYDVVDVTIQALVEAGAEAGSSPADVTKNADCVFTMLQTAEQVVSDCHSEAGVFANINKDAIYIDSSSIDIAASRKLHRAAKEAGVAMVDAPVSGGVAGAQAATLTIMVGGSEKDFAHSKKYLSLLGKNVVHAGPAGSGQIAKICNNMMLGISMIAVSEGFTLAKKLGLDPKKLFEIASNASGQCWSMTSYCPEPNILAQVPSSHDYKPGFAAEMMLKDLKLSQDAANLVELETPLGRKATALYTEFVNSGHADLDFSAIIKMLAGEE